MNIVVISPHPDDETLGCGGTLLKHKYNNDDIYWIIMTKPSNENYPKKFIKKEKRKYKLLKINMK